MTKDMISSEKYVVMRGSKLLSEKISLSPKGKKLWSMIEEEVKRGSLFMMFGISALELNTTSGKLSIKSAKDGAEVIISASVGGSPAKTLRRIAMGNIYRIMITHYVAEKNGYRPEEQRVFDEILNFVEKGYEE